MTIGGQNVVNTNAGVTAGGALQLAGGSGDLALKGVKVNATGDATLTGKNVTLAAAKVENDGQPAMTAGGHAVNATGSQVASGKARRRDAQRLQPGQPSSQQHHELG
ncbi:hypothetical protein EHI42_17870 [Rhizobium hidalgonense]|nr:hypothetical protein EHI42_17870 [Rhizobium hidalgonense]